MKLKKILATTAACALLVGTLAIPASAHGGGGHHGRRASGTTTYAACTVADCTLSYNHSHDGVTYHGHSAADGHTWCANGAGHSHNGYCH